MRVVISVRDFLTHWRSFLLIFLTFLLTVPHTFQFAKADTLNNWSQPNAFADPLADEERSHRIGQIVNYIKTQENNFTPQLPSELRAVTGWLKGGSQFGSYSLSETTLSPNAYNPNTLSHAPLSPESGEALWFSSNYNHKGFLPLHDAMVLGANLKHNLWSDDMQLSIHPYVGQNWHNIDNYWGTEIALKLGIEAGTSQEWGKIALRYDNGDSHLMEHGRGIDMHSEFNFTDHLSLNAGIRQDYISSIGNYMLLKWKIVGDP